MKLFDEAEELRTFNVIKLTVEHENYCVKFEEDKIIMGYEVIKAFGEMLGIAVEEKVAKKLEKTEVEEEKKLTPQQLRKNIFLKEWKRKINRNKKVWINGNREMGNSNISRILTMVILDIDNKGN